MTKVILGADSIHVPLTGIGRYAYELASRLPDCENIESLRLYSLGRWISPEVLTQLAEVTSPDKLNKPTLRLVLSRNKVAVRVFSALMPIWSQWRMRKENNSLFHSPNFFLPPFPGKAISTIHDLSHIACPQFHPAARVEFLKREMPKTLKRAHILLTDAESVKREVIEQYGWPEERIHSVPLGVDESFHPRDSIETLGVMTKYGLIHGQYSLYVGTIEPRKNLSRLIRTYATLPESVRMDCPLVLAGGKGWQAEEIHELMRTSANAGWLKYLNYVPQIELPYLYAGARLFCFPSLYEGFGLPPLEAMASGTPVLTSSTSSLPEVVGNVGLKAHPEDETALAQCLRMGVEDTDWRLGASIEGLKRSNEFTWQRCVDRTANLYQGID